MDLYEDLDSWHEIYNAELTLGENLVQIFQQAVYLGEPMLYQLLAAYVCIPTKIARVVPILAVHGLSGTGKSLIGFISSKVHGVTICTGADTFASIRNTLNKTREIHQGNALLVWDDIDPDIFLMKPDIYRMLKSGYDRASSTISIAKTNGEVQFFNTFALKILSSVHPMYNLPNPDLGEITRRCMVIKTTKVPEDRDLLDVRMINWKGFSDKFHKQWESTETCQGYLHYRKLLSKRKPGVISSERWIISVDVLTSGIIQGLWANASEAIDFIKAYWKWFDIMANANSSPSLQLLKQWVYREVNEAIELNRKIGIEEPIVIDPDRVKKQFGVWQARGMLDIVCTPKTVQGLMNKIGYKLTALGWCQYD